MGDYTGKFRLFPNETLGGTEFSLVDEGLSTSSICRYVVYLVFTFVRVHVSCVRIRSSQRSLFGVMDFFSSSAWYS